MLSRPGRSALTIAVTALCVMGSSCSRKPGTAAAPGSGGPPGGGPGGPGAQRAVPVLIAPVEKKDVPVWIEGLGTASAWQQVTVRTQVDGRLEQVLFREGQAVKKGQLLATIDPRPYLVQLHQAEGALARDRAQLLSGKRDLERYAELLKRGLVSRQQVDQQAATAGGSEGSVRIDEAAVESARLNLDYARIKAPLDGTVGVRLVDAGNLVHASDPSGIVVIAQLDPAAVLFTLPEDDLPRISAAQKRGVVKVEAWDRDGKNQLGSGTLAVVDNQINQATATLRLKALMPNGDRKLWPNQFVKARLLVDTRPGALVVPASAVQRGPQGTMVYVVGKDQPPTASMRPVEVVLATGDVAVLAGGVSPGEQVVVEGQNQLRPGATVSPRPASAGLGGGAGPADGKAGKPGAQTGKPGPAGARGGRGR